MSEWIRTQSGSWHRVKTWTRVPGRAITLCGKTVNGDVQADRDHSEKSCESCFRIMDRENSKATHDNAVVALGEEVQ